MSGQYCIPRRTTRGTVAPDERSIKSPRSESLCPTRTLAGVLLASAHVVNLLHDPLGPLHRSRNFHLIRQFRYFKIDNFMQLVMAISLNIVWVGSCEPWLPCYFCAEQLSVKSCPMPRRSQVPLRLERLTGHSGSQPELTAHPSPATPLRDHFGSVELQVALARTLRQDSTEPATPPLPAQVWLWLGNLRLQALPATSSRNITSTSESFGSGIYPS